MKLRVLFIIPPQNGHWYSYEGNTINPPHLGIAYIGTIIEQIGDMVQVIDGAVYGINPERLDKILDKFNPDIVGITATTPEIVQAGWIATEIKRFNEKTLVILGGVHVTVLPFETLQEFPNFDIAVCGEGEKTISEIMEKIKAKKDLSEVKGIAFRDKDRIKLNLPQDPIADLDNIPFPDWSLFNLRKYSSGYRLFKKGFLELSIQTKRGCPYRCIFCSRPWGKQVRYRSVKSIISEVEYVVTKFKPKSLAFVDETFTYNRERTLHICTEIINRGLNKKIVWKCATRTSDVDPSLLLKMRQSGCYLIFFGVESGDDNILKIIKKDSTLQDARNAIKWCKEVGIKTSATFVLGWPFETEVTMKRTLEFSKELDSDYVHFLPLIPYPKTELAKMAEKGIGGLAISNRQWRNYNFASGQVLELKNISYKKIKYKQIQGYLRFYMHPLKILNFFRFIQITKLFKVCLYSICQLGYCKLLKRVKNNS